MLYAIVVVLILIADQGLKYWVTLNIPLDTGHLTLIPGALELTNIHNYGAAFSILQNARWLFIAITIIFTVAVVFCLRRGIIHGRFGKWTAVLALAGAIGNCIDRLLAGYVVDMFNFPFMHFAVFNLADVFITVCGILFCLHVIFYRGEPGQTQPAPRAGDKARPRAAEAPKPSRPRPAHKAARIPARRAQSARPAEVQSVAVDPDDPFAAWDRTSPQQAVKPAQPAPKPTPTPVTPQPEPTTDFLSHLQQDAVPVEDDDFNFSLDDILQEFSDY